VAKASVERKAAAAKKAGDVKGGKKIVATNRKARHNYSILDVYEAGVVLVGTEVKSLRDGQASLADAFATVDDGEIWLRGPHIMSGYHHNPEATAQVIDADGWFQTGDLGRLDDDGYLHITGRKKEIIVTAGGKNVAPQPLENALKTDGFIAQAMVIGDRRNFISALIVPQPDVLQPWAEEQGLGGDLGELCANPAVYAHYKAIVDSKMASFSRYERVRAFTLVPEEFSQEAGELTPTLKLKRRVLLAKYAEIIDRMYG